MERPIVCGTDLSPTASEAAEVAAALARRLGTRLILIHVAEFYGMAEVDSSLFEAALSGKRIALEREANRLREFGTEVEIKLPSGSIFDELVTSATEANARSIVVGAVGHSLSQRLLLGSVAERTAESSLVPTLVIRPGSVFVRWLSGQCALKILVGYDFSAAGDAALAWAKELQSIDRCELTVFHVAGTPNELDDSVAARLSGRVANSLGLDDVRLEIGSTWGNPEGALFEAVEKSQADLILVGTHQRHGLSRIRFGSVSRAVLRHAKVSVAVIPSPQSVEIGSNLQTDPAPDRAGEEV